MNGRVLVLAVIAGVSLRLVPPGWRDRLHAARPGGYTQVAAALASGARPIPTSGSIALHAHVSPAPARLGQALVYHAHAFVTGDTRLRFVPPPAGGDFTWGTPRAGRTSTAGGRDSAWVEVPLQVFRTGVVSIPGPRLRITTAIAAAEAGLPTVQLIVLPTITASDSAATLRPLHGPLGAPWWERVAWGIVLAVMAVALAVFEIVRRARARGRKPVPASVPVAAARPAVDPAAEALMALAALRREMMPEQGRFGEHAQALTRILRRYLERTLGTPRPGDTSTELIARVRVTRLLPEDVQRLEGLLGLWDRVKFARAPLDVAEAGRCESAVEQLVRRRESPREVA